MSNFFILWMLLTGQITSQPMDYQDRYAGIHLEQIVLVKDKWYRGFGKVRQYGTVGGETGIEKRWVQEDYVNVDFLNGKKFSYSPYDLIIYKSKKNALNEIEGK